MFERWIDDVQIGQSKVGKALGNTSESRFRIVIADIVHLAEGRKPYTDPVCAEDRR